MADPGGTQGVQGLWRSDAQAELSLAETRGGMLVGLYRIHCAAGLSEHPLSGYVAGGHVVFSVRFAEHHAIATWTGSVVEGSDGSRLELVRRVLGYDEHAEVFETYSRVSSEGSRIGPLTLTESQALRLDSSVR